jgi:O-antigen/teichoic acid export membrane protein
MEELKNNLFGLLKKAEKYTKTDNLYLFKGGFFLTLSSVGTGILSFIMAIILGWLLPKEVYGNYKYLFSILGIIALFTLGGMDTAVTQAVARGQDGSFRTGFRKKLIFSFLGTLTAIAIAVFYFTQGKLLIGYGALLMGAFLPLWGPFGLYPAYFVGKGEFKNITKANVGSQALVAISVITAAYFYKNFLLLALANITTQIIVSGYVIWKIFNQIPKDAPKDPNTHKYGFHLSVIGILGTIANYLDNVLIFTFLGPIQLAVYNFAIAPPEQLKGLFKNVSSLAFPKFAKKSIEEIKKSIGKRMLIFALGAALLFLIYVVSARFLYSIFLPKYLDSVFYSQIYALAIILMPGYVIGAALESTSQTKALYTISIVGTITEIVLIAFLIPNFGLIGAVLSQVISRFFNFFIMLFVFLKTKSTKNQTVPTLE